MAKGGIDVAEPHDGDDAGQNEQPTGQKASARSVHQPADIGRELLGLRTRQEHAVIERMQEPAFGNPPLFLHQNAVHDRDLPGWTAETQHRYAQPDAKRFAKRHTV